MRAGGAQADDQAARGRIINVTSVVGQAGNAGQVNYAASKAGLIGMTKALALEVASRNITVNAVAPGLIDTDMTRAISAGAQEDWAARIPLKRLGTPDDVAAAVLFLASDEAAYITGHVSPSTAACTCDTGHFRVDGRNRGGLNGGFGSGEEDHCRAVGCG